MSQYTVLKNHVDHDNEYIFECDLCDKPAKANKLVWVKDELGNVLCYGKACWNKIKRGEA